VKEELKKRHLSRPFLLAAAPCILPPLTKASANHFEHLTPAQQDFRDNWWFNIVERVDTCCDKIGELVNGCWEKDLGDLVDLVELDGDLESIEHVARCLQNKTGNRECCY
jgi:hypothetical protein